MNKMILLTSAAMMIVNVSTGYAGTYKYDDDGRLVEKQEIDSYGNRHKYVYTYYTNDNATEDAPIGSLQKEERYSCFNSGCNSNPYSATQYTYTDGKISGGTYGTSSTVSVTTDPTTGNTEVLVNDYKTIYNAKGQVIMEGVSHGSSWGDGSNPTIYAYEYNDDDTLKSRTSLGCEYAATPTNCTPRGVYDYVYGDYGEIIGLKAQGSDTMLESEQFVYSDGYYDKKCTEKSKCTICSEGKILKEKKCVSSLEGCGENFKLNDGECDRIRYTPAEAAAAMNGDDNTIIMTFKVNR